jgi:hypothetical protein
MEELGGQLLHAVIAGAFALIGWLMRTLWSNVDKVQKDLVELKDKLHDNYTRKDDFKEFRETLMQMLTRIEGKIDNKADKP